MDAFLKACEAEIRSNKSEADKLRVLKNLMAGLVNTPGSIPEEVFRPRQDRFAKNLVYRPEDRVFSVMGGNWLPGQTTPIHDHLTWAVVGVYEGEEREAIFQRMDVGENPGVARLKLVSERTNTAGHVTTLGKTGIHMISNVSGVPSLSIHMYGLDIGTTERHSYDPVSGEVTKFVSGYCNVLRDED